MNIEVGRVSFSLIGRKPNNTIGPLAAFSVNDIVVAMEKRAENMLVRPKLFDIFSSSFMFFFFLFSCFLPVGSHTTNNCSSST